MRSREAFQRRLPAPASGTRSRRGAGLLEILCVVAGILSGLAGPAPAAQGADAAPSRSDVKASHLTKLPLFITWPESAFADPAAPVVIGILGDDPFGTAFDEAVRPLKINGRGFEIRRYQEPEDARSCHILYVNVSEKGKLARVLSVLRDQPVLTIGDVPGFAEQGGMFNFIVEDRRVRFECNREAVRLGGLKVSGKLLQISRIVRD